MESVTGISNSRVDRKNASPEAATIPPYLSGITRINPEKIEIVDGNTSSFTIKVSGGIFAGTVVIKKTGRYLFISDGGETTRTIEEDFLNILFEETTDDSLLMEDYVRAILVDKGIQVTHSGVFQIVVPIPAEHEYNALLGACFALDEGTAFVKRMAECFKNASGKDSY